MTKEFKEGYLTALKQARDAIRAEVDQENFSQVDEGLCIALDRIDELIKQEDTQ